MTFGCYCCAHEDAHTNAGALFCHSCSDLLSDEEKQRAIERRLGPEEKAA